MSLSVANCHAPKPRLLHVVLLVLAASVGCQIFAARLGAQDALIYGGHTYQLVKEQRTWQNAAFDAVGRTLNGHSGHLAEIEHADENAALFQLLTQVIPTSEYNNTRAPDGGNGVYVWIGASDIGVEGDWIWDGDGDGDGALFWQGLGRSGGAIVDDRYNNWGHYPTAADQWEPDNSRGTQDAAGIGVANWPRGFAGEWNDVQPTNSLYYLVEFDTLPRVGDVNLDSIVDSVDGQRIVENLFSQGTWLDGDLNDDGLVDGSDFNVWYAHRNPAAPALAVPESASAIRAVFLLMALAGLRRSRPDDSHMARESARTSGL